jgi:hypothetical protein
MVVDIRKAASAWSSDSVSKAFDDFLELRTDLLSGQLEALIIDSLH